MFKKRGQEEIVGFVLIMVLVAVVFLVFLGIYLRNPVVQERKSENIYQFLESSMEQTTSCAILGRQELLDLGDLLSECYSSNIECSDGNESCFVLNNTFENMLENSFVYGGEYPLKGYSLETEYSINSTGQTNPETILKIIRGNCNGSIVGNSYWAPEFPGSITTTLKLCY
jgi:hypothetical protein